MLRLFQTLGNFNNTLNLVFNSHVHLEKLNMLEKNKVKDAKNVLIYDEKLGDNAIHLNSISFKPELVINKFLFNFLLPILVFK